MTRRPWILAAVAAAAVGLAWMLLPSPADPPAPAEAPRPAIPRPAPPVVPAASAPAAPAPIAAPSPALAPAAAPAPAADARAHQALRALDAQLAALREQTLDVAIPEGATRDEEDAIRVARMKAVSAEAARLRKAYEDLIAGTSDPRAEVLARIALGDLQEALAADLEEAPVPTYLTDAQAEAWRDGMQGKAEAQYDAAAELWDRAAAQAAELPPDPEIEALLAERAPEE